MPKYKVINTTVKQPKPHPTTGKDLRNWTEKQGHGVQFKDPHGDIVRVDTNRPRITDYVTEGMYRLQRGKYIRIEEIGDVVEVLKNHTLSKNPSTLLDPDTLVSTSHTSAVPRTRAVAVEMGQDQSVARGENHMVNPDGEPNFTVKADKNVKRKHKVEAAAPAPEAT